MGLIPGGRAGPGAGPGFPGVVGAGVVVGFGLTGVLGGVLGPGSFTGGRVLVGLLGSGVVLRSGAGLVLPGPVGAPGRPGAVLVGAVRVAV